MNKRSHKLILALTAGAVFAAGCTTLDPYTREEKTSQATKGAPVLVIMYLAAMFALYQLR